MKWWSRLPKCIIILDNLDMIEVIDDYLPDLSNSDTHFLITSRNQHYDQIPVEGLVIGVMDIDDGVKLFLLRSNVPQSGDTLEAAQTIVDTLGCLPLAIEQSAAFIREASINIFSYLKSYHEDRKHQLDHPSRGNRMYYCFTVVQTVEVVNS